MQLHHPHRLVDNQFSFYSVGIDKHAFHLYNKTMNNAIWNRDIVLYLQYFLVISQDLKL